MTIKLTHVQVGCLYHIRDHPNQTIRLIQLNSVGYSTATVTRLRTAGYVAIENGIVTLTDNGKAFIRFSVN
nr:MAG TPA: TRANSCRIPTION REGULATORY PROTEIN MOTA DOMAIN, PHAGE T4, MIDDLE.19A [Caudoviricetes sp.]